MIKNIFCFRHSKTTTIAKVNQVEILLIENGEKRVAIKPICEALGISHKPQIEKLKTDPILSSVVTLSMTTGSGELPTHGRADGVGG